MNVERLQELRDQITSRVLGHWWDHQLSETSAAIAPLTGSLPAVARVNGFLNRDTFLRVARMRRIRRRIAALDGPGGEQRSARQPLLACLSSWLAHSDSELRVAALAAVEALGSVAATPEILARLAELLQDQDSDVQYAAAKAAGVLGSVAATPEILARLAELLQDQEGRARNAAVGALGSVAATPAFLARLTELFQDQNEDVREAAAEAVGALGRAAATPEILARLAELLQDQDSDVRKAAAKAMQSFRQLGVRLFAQHRWLRRTLDRPRWVKELAEQTIAANGSSPGLASRAIALLKAHFRIPPRT